jgi:hypothetical protein
MAALNGIALQSLTRPYGGTFLTFSDYMRPAVRLAALMQIPVIYVWTHDSIGLGEDGRAAHGGYILAEATGGSPAVLLIGTGSEVQIALDARDQLQAGGVPARVISMPCREWFAASVLYAARLPASKRTSPSTRRRRSRSRAPGSASGGAGRRAGLRPRHDRRARAHDQPDVQGAGPGGEAPRQPRRRPHRPARRMTGSGACPPGPPTQVSQYSRRRPTGMAQEFIEVQKACLIPSRPVVPRHTARRHPAADCRVARGCG